MKTLKFNDKENQPYNIGLIERIKVKSFFNDDWLESEHWGWNDEGENKLPFFDFGCFGEIMFEIGKSYIRLYFPHTINFSYTEKKPCILYANPYQKQTVEDFSKISPFTLDTELEFKNPVNTMFDLRMHLQGFINQVKIDIENLKNNHAIWIEEMQNTKPLKKKLLDEVDDLPF
jgi:hypothetical protein